MEDTWDEAFLSQHICPSFWLTGANEIKAAAPTDPLTYNQGNNKGFGKCGSHELSLFPAAEVLVCLSQPFFPGEFMIGTLIEEFSFDKYNYLNSNNMFMCKSWDVKVSAVILTYPWKWRKCVGCPPSFFWQPHCLHILGPGMCLSSLPASSYSHCCCTVRLISSLSAYLPHCWTLRLVQHRKLGAMRHVWDMFGCQNPVSPEENWGKY